MASQPLRLVYSYSHEDERMLERLRKHLAVLRRHGLIAEWYDRDIEAGSNWRAEIEDQFDRADLILLLVSADFLDSDFCYEEEMRRAIERSDRGEAKVIAVILRPVDGWQETPFAKLQVVPRDGRPISLWPNADEAYSDAAAKIRSAVEDRARSMVLPEKSKRISAPTPADAKVKPSSAAREQEILSALGELLKVQAEPRHREQQDAFVIVAGPADANYYTQCIVEDPDLWCEAVSNKWLDPSHALRSEQMSQLAGLGWNPPTAGVENWWCIRQEPTQVAALMVATLSDVYGLKPNQLQVTRGWTGS